MIIDTPKITDLGIGVGRTITQQGDSQLVVPPAIQPICLLISPTRIASVTTDVQNTSFLANVLFSAGNNAVQQQIQMCILSKGYWDCDLSIDGITSGFHNDLILVQFIFPNFSPEVLRAAGFNNLFHTGKHFVILLQDQVTINVVVAAQGPAETCSGIVQAIFNKVL